MAHALGDVKRTRSPGVCRFPGPYGCTVPFGGMSVVEDVLDWTEAGRAAFVREAGYGVKSLRGVGDTELRAKA